MIVAPTDFSAGKLEIPNITLPPTITKVTACINDFEPVFLKMLLGKDLAAELLVQLANPEPAEKWASLNEKVKPSLLIWLYFNFRRENISSFTAAGETRSTKTGTENSEVVSPRDKLVRRWNEMVDLNLELVQNWDVVNYGPYYFPYLSSYLFNRNCNLQMPEIFERINPIF